MLRARLRRVLFAFVAVVSALLLLEGLARLGILIGLHTLLPPNVREWVESKQVVFDPDLGWRPASGFPSIQGGNFKRDAFTGDAVPRAAGELRGYAFGDSQTHGAGLAEDVAWPSMTERALREDGVNIRVINLGSSGYRSAQVLRLMETYAVAHRPDFFLVDCMVADSEALPRDYGHRWAPVRRVLFESRVYRLLALGIASARGQNTGPMGAVTIEQPPAASGGAGNHAGILALANSEHIPVIFLDYPFSGHPIHALAPADKLPKGATVVGVTAALQATGKPSEELFLENNHLSAEGSEVVGRAVADVLKAKLKQ